METPRPLKLSLSFTTTTPLKHSPAIFHLLAPTSNRNPNSFCSSSSSIIMIHCCYAKKPPPRKTPTTATNSSYWDSNAETFRSDRYKFKFGEESVEDDDYNSGSMFRWRENPKRKWWSDGDVDDDDDYDSPQVTGVVEDVIDKVWFFKVFRSFGWLLPAIIISMLLATGPKAFLMALALPIGQSAVSFAIDKVFGRTEEERPKSRRWSRSKRKPFSSRGASSSSSSRAVEIDEEEVDEEGYQSWVAASAANNGSSAKQQKKEVVDKRSFGGWDELDDRRESRRRSQTPSRSRTRSGQGLEKGKMSRRGGDTPLLFRLLIAVFPFLGSWTRLF